MASPSHRREPVLKAPSRWFLNTQTKLAGRGDMGCLRFSRYNQALHMVSRILRYGSLVDVPCFPFSPVKNTSTMACFCSAVLSFLSLLAAKSLQTGRRSQLHEQFLDNLEQISPRRFVICPMKEDGSWRLLLSSIPMRL